MLMPVLHVSMSLPNVKRTKKISSHCWTKIGEILVKKTYSNKQANKQKSALKYQLRKTKQNIIVVLCDHFSS